jgi:hypothetical protein
MLDLVERITIRSPQLQSEGAEKWQNWPPDQIKRSSESDTGCENKKKNES